MDEPINEGLARRRPAHEALLLASNRLADCPTVEASDAEFRRRVQLLEHAALVYAATRKTKPRWVVLVDGPDVEDRVITPTGVACPHCKLQLVLVLGVAWSATEVAKEARLRLVQHAATCRKRKP